MTGALRVLIAAEHASARFGGEAALPLHYFRVLERRGIAVWLVTHARTRDELQELYPGNDRIVYVEDTAFHRTMWRIGRRLPPAVAYITTGFFSRLSTQLAQRKIVKRLIREHAIAVVHQPMPVSPREPSLLYGFGVPVVMGPMNGGMDYPLAFRRRRGGVERALMWIGQASAAALNSIMPGKRDAAALLVANQRTRDALPAGASRNVIELVENGVDLALWTDVPDGNRAPVNSGVVTFVFMGRLVDWKAVDLLLLAFARARANVPMRLCILGDGDERASLEQLARELALTGSSTPAGAGADEPGTVEFTGWLPQAACADRLRAAHCLVLPSLLECGGAVVLEAMSLGKPVIATAWGGPLDYLDANCGVLVPPDSRESMIASIAAALTSLAGSEALRESMGACARAKVLRMYDWEAKVDRVLAVYEDVVGTAGPHGRLPAASR